MNPPGERELARMLAGSTCWYDQDGHLGEARCSERAVFSVLRRDFDPFRPDPVRDNRECCEEHLPVTVLLTDEDAGSGFDVHVTVIASVADRLASEIAAAGVQA